MPAHMDLDAIFKAYDIRGRVPGELDADAARRIGGAFARFTGADRIAVGRDCRLSSPDLAAAFVDGATIAGVDVLELGEISTDMVYFVSGEEGLPGAMITASHNPKAWNGIKLCGPGAKPIGAESGLAEIKELAEAGVVPAAARGEVTAADYRDRFVDHLLDIVGGENIAALDVVVDGGNGMAGAVIPAVFERIPANLIGLYLPPDGTFPNHHPDPLQPENLEDLLAEMERTGAAVGVAFDGDADRAFFVDDRLQPLSGSTTTAIVAKWFLAREPGAAIVHNLITSRAVPETVRNYGGRPVRTRVGHSYIKKVMADEEAAFGGEHSGHYYFRENFRADSGILAMLVLLRALSEDGRPLSEMREEFEPYAQSGEINLAVDDQQGAMDRVAGAFDGAEPDWTDGLTLEWDDRWFNLRPSNTEPVLRLNVEGATAADVDRLVGEVREIVGG